MTTSPHTSQQPTHRRHVIDAVAVVLALPFVMATSFDLFYGGLFYGSGIGPPAVWALLMVAPLAVRRRHPVPSAVAVFGVGALQVVIGPGLVMPANLAVLVALYSVTLHGPRWAGRAAMAGVVAGALVVSGRGLATFSMPSLIEGGLAFVMLVTLGLATWGFALLKRSRQETLDALRDRADRLERERDQQAQLATAAERARIAREMHDVVAHSLSIVVAQADGGRYAATQDPAAATAALDTISDTGRAALADMRRILGVLRNGTDTPAVADAGTDGTSGSAPLAPQPAVEDVDELMARVRAAGLRVSVAEVGQPRLLPPGMELTVYRILQEALTNVLKHAGPDPTVTVLRRWDAQTLTLDITDDGRGAAAEEGHDAGAGHGLVGMRERVALFDGTVQTGPRDGGGFRVRVELPLPAASASPAAVPPPSGPPTSTAPPTSPPAPAPRPHAMPPPRPASPDTPTGPRP